MALNARANEPSDVCCWGKTGRIAGAPLLRLVTQSGHPGLSMSSVVGFAAPLSTLDFTLTLTQNRPASPRRRIEITAGSDRDYEVRPRRSFGDRR
jgi:hypothetical protein